ncbi:receptor like protein 29-like [Salvia miltiorrhiza]|uniref:receptor like protein 29-like n=1 Tax=Salvia miltiorrhiza TaxID=226208 RepID=UPI0025AD285E|nr:receptor like protein 29-like [Salvia miltiorrhiza]
MASAYLFVVAILVFCGGAACYDGGAGMEEGELFGLFEVMGSLLEDPTWAEMHPLPCTDTPWPGVECGLMEETSVFHVTKIHVGDDVVSPPCKSSARISLSLLKLPYLRTLSLINCFTDSPVSLNRLLFQSLSSLEHLTLDSNPALIGEIPSTISNLASLKTLCLSQNNLSGQIPKQIGDLVNLQQLVLSHNNFTGPIPREIGAMEKLTILDLSLNSLQETLPSSIGDLASLEKIDLSWNELRGAPPPELGKLRRLNLLDLSHNSFTGPIHENLSGMQQLQYLIMDANPLNSKFPSITGSLTRLAVLSLSRCALYGPIPSVFSSLTNLTALSLDDNRLDGAVPAEIGALRSLDTLNLSRNHLSGRLLFPQDFMNRIGQRLDIRENDGLCADVAVRTSNMSSRLLQNPSCDTVIFAAPSNKTMAADHTNRGDRSANLKPDLYGDDDTSSDHRDSDTKLVLFFEFVSLLFLLLAS